MDGAPEVASAVVHSSTASNAVAASEDIFDVAFVVGGV